MYSLDMSTTSTTTAVSARSARALTSASRRKVWRKLRIDAYHAALDGQHYAMKEIGTDPSDSQKRAEWRKKSDAAYTVSDAVLAIADAMCPRKRIA
jgi:hypothetical protein